MSETDLIQAQAKAWCVVSHHAEGEPARLLFGDPESVFGIPAERFDTALLESRIVGEMAQTPWQSQCGQTLYLIEVPGREARWLESSSLTAADGGLLMSTRPATLGSYEEFVGRARLSLGGSLLGPMAHELNNLIQGLSSAEYLFRDSLENNDPIEMEDVDQLAEAVTELKTMGAELQGFARLGPGEAEDVSLPKIVHRASRFLSSLGRLGVVDFASDVPEDLPNLRWPAIELDFVVLALLANAVDASLEPGDNATVAFQATQTESGVDLTVTNSGAAIRLAVHATPWVGTKSEHRHQGLGLSAVLAILTTRGGSLRSVEHEGGTKLIASIPNTAREAITLTSAVPTVPIP